MEAPDASAPRLVRFEPGRKPSPDEILERFLDHVSHLGLTLYPAQEEALLEVVQGRHLVLNTPTGSGKSLVALALHFKTFCEGGKTWYTSPIKALVNEKFFALCDAFGPENVGMMTGDASINREAPVVCCTAEILSNLSLREGEATRADSVVMDEFHYYADRDRGVAWQVPLLVLRRATFLLMSATLGDTSSIEERLKEATGREVSVVRGLVRPVPLDFEYRTSPLHETIEDLLRTARAPVYLVNFTQRACAEQAQNLMSVEIVPKEGREAIRDALADFRFDTPYGKELQRFIRRGVGVHHAGLLPRYRRLVERLAQQNLLKVVSGTDTLGVGVNIPIRTVLFTQLCKFDGEKTIMLPVGVYQQIAGRTGRKGFDDRGWVLAQAPEHVIENIRLAQKAAGGKKVVKKQPPTKGYVHFDEQTFERLRTRLPEPLESRFDVTHGMLLVLLQRPVPEGSGRHDGYRMLLDLIARSHESEKSRHRLKLRAAQMFRTLRHAGIVEVVPHMDAWPARRSGSTYRVDPGLQYDFSLHHTLSLFLLDALEGLDPESPTHAPDVLSLVESILDSPRVVLFAQIHRLKGEKIAKLKADGVPYEDRLAELEKVEHPKPLADYIYPAFNEFEAHHPWVGDEDIRPKSIARELYERGASFHEYVRDYGLERVEGVLLRYLADAGRTLDRNVPERFHTEAVVDVIAYLRNMLREVDSSLLEEWERMQGVEPAPRAAPAPRPFDPAADPKAFRARVRSELQRLARALALGDGEDALRCVHDPDGHWTAESLLAAYAPLRAEHGGLDLTPRARKAEFTTLRQTGPRTWDATQRLLAQDGDDLWMLDCEIDLESPRAPDAPLVALRRIGT